MLVTERRAESIQPGHLAARACGCYGVLFFQQQIDHMRLPRSIVPARLVQRNKGSDEMVSPQPAQALRLPLRGKPYGRRRGGRAGFLEGGAAPRGVVRLQGAW